MLLLLYSPLTNVQKAILRSENTFFVNDARFAHKHFKASKHYLKPILNMLGHIVRLLGTLLYLK